ncbi:hypothetical protein XENTR_v10000378 [Xenopus tropicalis]|uniref:Zinc finger protein 518B n=1 Tax=Xenopus tropicalis TaxID=8364 RepID=Q5M7J4_XENTR|nr:zinc finger protein 518B [Xenopus tropicalis]XP_031751201.1 zinc finger protein 518B [Xenopus tropicalis]AAH88611.1 zinc finger protein 518B [Xenopus tropicalis]KAE8629159.1 hypothetical protein XENTR_v10000378 [Xenopus tropicalis]|eukprot:NP_001011402.1 zinc finger protein 518B [Xenopus tropicalis]
MTSEIRQFQPLTKYNCQKCRFSTKDPKRYRTHVSIHNDIKFACSHCSYVSYTKGDFQRHLVTHTGKFPYTCEYCGYGAVRNDYIVKHIRRIHGDGKIQCSVSGAENDLKNASVNLIQSQLQNSPQESLQTKTSNVIDLTNDAENGDTRNAVDSNGNKISAVQGVLVEVEVMSPLQEELRPEMPLTVVAPSGLKVPNNCFAQVVDVRPINGTYRLILQCLKQGDSELVDLTVTDKTCEEQCLENNSNTNPPTAGTTVCSLGGNVSLNEYGSVEALSNPVNTDKGPSATCFSQTQVATDKQINVESDTQINSGNVSPIQEGPFISSVFSLSSGSQNILEGIRWEKGHASSRETKAPQDTSKTLNTPPTKSANSTVAGNTLSMPETPISSVKSLPFSNSLEMQSSSLLNRVEMNVHKDRSHQTETNICAKPQTLFLSCDKSVVMQPVTCAVQNDPKMSIALLPKSITSVTTNTQQQKQLIDAERTNKIGQNGKMQTDVDNGQSLKSIKKQKSYSKEKEKTLFKPVSSQTLRLLPLKEDQLLQIPSFNQPVVVLNHPDLDTLEIISVMTAISKFKGKVLSVTLCKQMCEPNRSHNGKSFDLR